MADGRKTSEVGQGEIWHYAGVGSAFLAPWKKTVVAGQVAYDARIELIYGDRMADTADVVIIGAGITGLNTAFQIARRSSAKVIVLDKGAGPGEGSTGASSAVCRFKYSRNEMVTLARDGINAYQNWAEYLNLSNPFAKFNNTGVLWMCSAETKTAQSEAARLASLGIRTELLDDQALKERFPAINPCPITPDCETGEEHQCEKCGAHFLEIDGGYVEPVDALQDLVAACKTLGMQIRFNTPAINILKKGGAVFGVQTSEETIACNTIVNAAGPWCRHIFQLAGVNCGWPLVPTRIQIVHIKRPPEIEGNFPVCADPPGGIYFRPQNNGQQIVVGSVMESDEQEAVNNPDDYKKHADDEFIVKTLHALQHRLPKLKIAGHVSGYSGLYTINLSDVHPIVGETELKGFYAANGFSGHGFKIAPAIGSMLAQQIIGSHESFETDVAFDFLAVDRKPIEIQSKSVLA